MRTSLGNWVRWGWLATTLALSAALVIMAWVGLERARAAASTLDLGQGQLLIGALRQTIRAEPALPDSARLDAMLRAHADSGLRFLALFDPDHHLLGTAGATVAGLPVLPDSPPQPASVEKIGGRRRMVESVLPAHPTGPTPEPAAGQARPRFHPPFLVLEFEPQVSERLVAEATRTFALSTLVAAALLGAALFFWRLTVRQEATERRLEHERRLGALGEMSAVLAHEIRNPLASLKGHAQLLAERLNGGGPERAKAELVVREAQRLESLTGDLLEFARSGPIERKPVDPAALVRACVEEVDAAAFAVEIQALPGLFPLDERRARQALTNVLRNARQASGDDHPSEVRVSSERDTLVVEVRDFGPGVTPGEERRIFSPFYTTRTTGTGLGLTISLRATEMHGGTVTVERHPDGGAIFRLTFRAG